MGRSAEDAIAALARRQHGNITRDQLLALGLGPAAIAYRGRTRRLFRVHLGVYAVGTPPSTPVQRACAAVLACGPRAALSHGSALALWGLASRWPAPVHVIAPGYRRRPGIVTHQSRGLTRNDLRTELGIRVTSPARTLLDCAADLGPTRLVRVAADARRAGRLHPGALEDVTARFPHHPGCPHVAPLLDEPAGVRLRTRSELEQAFLAFCRRYGLPTPLVNPTVGGHEVDALFVAERLIVELDGWDFHRDRHVFESDRNRDADTLAAGLATVRITWERISTAERREAHRLHAILARRREK